MRADRDQAAAEREPAAWGTRGQDARQDKDAAPQAEAFRLPSADERAARARDGAARREDADSPAAGDDFWDRVSEEVSGSGSQGPVRPAWPSTAGPRAMGAGSGAKYVPAETGDDEPDAAWSPPGYRQAEPAFSGGETSRSADRPEADDEQAERPAAGEAPRERMVPPYVDDLTRPRRDREPAGPGSGDLPAREDSPAEEAAAQEAGSVWSAWSGFRAARAEEQAVSGDDVGQGERRGEDEPRRGDEQRRERAGRAESGLAGRVVPGIGPPAGELAESGPGEDDVTSGATAGDEAGGDEIAAAAPATDLAADERDDSGSAEPAAALDATPSAALADAAAETDEAAESGTDTEEPGTCTAEAGHAEAGDRAAGGADHAGDAAETREHGDAGPGAAGTAGEASGIGTGETSGGTARGDDGAAGAAGTLDTDQAGPPGHAEGDRTGAADTAEAEASSGEDIAGAEDRADAGAGGTGRAGGREETDTGEHAGQAADGGTPLDDEVTIVPGVARYHRRGCILIRFLSDGDLENMTRREAEATGLVPCKACQPDKPDPSA